MPELPEVERGRRLAESCLLGQQIARVAATHDPIVLAGVSPRRFANALKDRRIERICRRGKHIWFELDRRPWPLFHFGMTGSFQVYREQRNRPRFWKVELLTTAGDRLAMTNKRRLGRIRLLDDPPGEPPIAALGFDPLLDMPSPRWWIEHLQRRNTPIKALLLDQGFAAGVGNWIADEVLYQSGIAPHRLARDLTDSEIRRIRSALGRIVRRAVQVDADKERFPRTWLFHHRWGKNAEARTARDEPIIHTTVAGRTTAWVPAVQK